MLLNKENFKAIFIRNLVKYFNLIVFVVIIAIGLISYFYLFSPKIKQIKELKEINFSSKLIDLSRKSEHLKKFNELEKNYKKITPLDLAKIKQTLPEEADLSGLFVQLQNIGQEYNLQLLSIAVLESKDINKAKSSQESAIFNLPGQVKKSNPSSDELKNVKTINISIQYRGLAGYTAFRNFLAAFENNVRLFDVNNLEFNLPESGDKSGAINLNFETYYLDI